MDFIANYINFYYMLTFMSACFYIFNKTKLLKKTNLDAALWTLIVGAIVGIVFFFVMDTATEALITTFAIGTSFYEIIIKRIVKKFKS